jgi:hypothetical protein
MRKTTRITCIFLALFTLLVLAGTYPAAKTEKGYVMKEWCSQMRELGIVPIFPPREDVQVGDIYVYPYDPSDSEIEKLVGSNYSPIGMSPRWAQLEELSREVSIEYAKRIEFAKCNNTSPGLPTPYHAASDASSSLPSINRLRLVAFPEFMSVTFSEGQLSALIPVEAITAALGVGWSDEKSITVKIPSAESYAVNACAIFDHLLDPLYNGCKLKNQYSTGLPFINNWYANYLSPSQQKNKSTDSLWVIVITEIFYTRSVEVSIENKKTRGLFARTPNTGDTSTSLAQQAEDAIKRADTLNKMLSQGIGNIPGGSIRYVTASDSKVSMRREWAYPVAIGYRGMVFQVDKFGFVENAMVSAHDNPSIR